MCLPFLSFCLTLYVCRRRRACDALCESKRKHIGRTSTHAHVNAYSRHIFSFLSVARCCLLTCLRVLMVKREAKTKERINSCYPCCFTNGIYMCVCIEHLMFIVCRREYRTSNSRFDFLLISPAAAVIARYSDSNDNDNLVQK